MRRIEPKREMKDYESESSAIRRIQTGESLWDNIHKKKARIKAGSGEKMRDKGDKGAPTPDQMKRAQEETEKNINITEEDMKISPKLITLLRMGLVEKGELETMKRALKGGEDSLKQPVLRKQIFELFNKLVEAVTDDQQIWVRMRTRLTKVEKGEEE
jgi:hypothetical protein